MLTATWNSVIVQVLPNPTAMFGNLTFRFKSLILGSQMEKIDGERVCERETKRVRERGKIFSGKLQVKTN